ncbi:hypothetical protein Ddye_018262 [Dipteronia dyeriana]|uniref:DDE Tnp4 domain-containing protein n=1 Tax=Dipteronia dyeriana TaxID=168575 RepID=A0AAD9UAS5_9ROSI|nr:hypothetical protein Ddye_018262 [Dipteronia dyeriana]
MNDQENEKRNLVYMWKRSHQLATVQIVCIVVHWLMCHRRNYISRPTKQSMIHKQKVRDELMNQHQNNQRCRDIIRMGTKAFNNLYEILKRDGGFQPTKLATTEEQVAKFLYILSHNVKNRAISFFFRLFGETISRHFHRVLRSIITLEDQFLQQPTGSNASPEVRSSNMFYPYFKDCVGAIDGTHVFVEVSRDEAPRYRGRKGYPTLNVLAAYSFDLKFTYILPGLEGTASDSRIIKNALTREDKLIIPNGKHYLVDAGYMLRSGLIAPYGGVRYHLKEYSSHPPQNSRELFNLRRTSLGNAIERAFGVLNKRFPIIGSTTEPNYSADTQSSITLACCILHNYLMGVDPDESLIEEVDKKISNEFVESEEVDDAPINVDENHFEVYNNYMIVDEDATRGEFVRDALAIEMWRDCINLNENYIFFC